MAQSFSTDQAITNRGKMIVNDWGSFEFLTLGAIESEVIHTFLADGKPMPTGKLSASTADFSVYLTDLQVTFLHNWYRACKNGKSNGVSKATVIFYKTDNTPRITMEIPTISVGKFGVSETGQELDGEPMKYNGTFHLHDPDIIVTL